MNVIKPQWIKEEEELEEEEEQKQICNTSNALLLNYRNSNNQVKNRGQSQGSSGSQGIPSTTKIYLDQQRLNLPIRKHRRQILYALEKYKVIIIVGETGSGKSTQIPQYLVEAGGWTNPLENKRILCTQPRRIAATSLVTHESDERGDSLGVEVGHSVRLYTKMDVRALHEKHTTHVITQIWIPLFAMRNMQ